MIARGVMLGPDQPVIIHMLDIKEAAEALNGVKMELIDGAFPLLRGKPLEANCSSYVDLKFCCNQCLNSCITIRVVYQVSWPLRMSSKLAET